MHAAMVWYALPAGNAARGSSWCKGYMAELRKYRRLIGGLVILLAVAWLVIAFLQSGTPEPPAIAVREDAPPGTTTVESLARAMETQLNGFGGWLPNDLPLTPGWFLDNLPNFQLGVLQAVRHGSRVLRDNLSRQRTSDAVHREADAAYSAFANDPGRWAFPSAEGAFGRGVDALRRFEKELGTTAHFYPRADNLVQLLEPLVSELGAVNTLLLESRRKTAWRKIDDNFYYAQGVGWGILLLMRAVKVDFARVLEDKNALEIMDLAILSLEESQFEPLIVTNGDKAGILANHSSNLKAFLDDARQKMGSLISILKQG
jgi:hypothetical protein